MAAFNLIWQPYWFRGSEKPTGTQYCIRGPDGNCCLHGIVFGPVSNVPAELPPPMNTWQFPTRCEFLSCKL